MPTCRYCREFHNYDPAYPRRRARHNLDTDYPRCHRHWRYVCDLCGQPSHFNGLTWCSEAGKLTCLHCATVYRQVNEPFWGWDCYWDITCPHCGASHPALDRLEYEGCHPWQVLPGAERRRLGLSQDTDFRGVFWSEHFRFDEGTPDDETMAAQWNVVAPHWDARYGEEGDRWRVYLLNSALLGILGDVAGKRILDAGCGNGYLCRMLARRGAKVVGVDLAPGWIEMARSREPELGIEYHVGSIAHTPFLADGSFEAVVSVCVLTDTRDYGEALGEMYRVLAPGGILAIAIMHPCFASPPGYGWERHPVDSTRPEDRWHWRVNSYLQCTWETWRWEPVGTATGFHRPLSDYMQTLLGLGFRLTHFIEPAPSPELVAADPAAWAPDARIPLFLVIGAIKERFPSKG